MPVLNWTIFRVYRAPGRRISSFFVEVLFGGTTVNMGSSAGSRISPALSFI